jgi:signal transduction histidine kinase
VPNSLAGLRTLLEVTLANGNADVALLQAVCREALTLGGQQERLVDVLLDLASSERGVTAWDTVDLAHVGRSVLASRHERASAQGIRAAERLSLAETTVDPRLVESLVVNLIENALGHNDPDGFVEITTKTDGGHVMLTIVNSGPFVPGDQLERLLRPFERLSPGRSHRHDGYGLGLAIVNAVTDAHHATLDIRARPAGGLHVTVEFAASSSAHRRSPPEDDHRGRSSSGAPSAGTPTSGSVPADISDF